MISRGFSALLLCNLQLDFRSDFAAQRQSDLVLAEVAQGAVGQQYFALLCFMASRGDGVSDIAGTDGAQQFAFVASVGFDGDDETGEFVGAGLCSCQFFG